MDVKEHIVSRGLVFPEYEGGAINSVMAGLVSLLNGHSRTLFPSKPLSERYTNWIAAEIDRVALIILDGLGYNMLREYIDDHRDTFFAEFERQGRLLPLTSVAPSTTVVAMTSIWYSAPPSIHGMAGFEIFLKEIGCTANMLRFSPVAASAPGLLESYGLKAEELVKLGGIDKLIGESDVKVFSLLNRFIVDSPLSRAIHKGIHKKIGIINMWDEFYLLGETLTKESPPFIAVAYWPALDSLAHHYGPSHEVWQDEMETISRGLEKLIKNLRDDARKRTLFVITADHGFVHSPPSNSVNIMEIKGISESLLMLPTGESRFTYLTVKNGKMEGTIEILRDALGKDFLVIPSREAFEDGLFGPPVPKATFLDRIGDIIVTPTGNKNIVWNNEENELIGRHGGLTQREMLVPFLAAVF